MSAMAEIVVVSDHNSAPSRITRLAFAVPATE